MSSTTKLTTLAIKSEVVIQTEKQLITNSTLSAKTLSSIITTPQTTIANTTDETKVETENVEILKIANIRPLILFGYNCF